MVWKVIKCFLLGLLVGIVLPILLYALFFILELGNCFYQMVTCKCDGSGDMMPGIWKWSTFFNIGILCVVGCSAIGMICGIIQVLNSKREEAAERRRREEMNAKAYREANAKNMESKIGVCCNNIYNEKKYVYSYTFSLSHESKTLMENFCHLLTEAYQDNAVIISIAEESGNE